MRKRSTRVVAVVLIAQLIIAAAKICAQPPSATSSTSILVSGDKVVHVMASGAGASWQAIGSTGFWYKKTRFGHRPGIRARGSGWGGTPTVDYTDAWEDLRRHAHWLGLDFVRVELDMRMYEPERGRFDWDNDEMQMLYRILDVCQEIEADVFLTQMWQDVEWNAYEDVSRLTSAPKSVEDFAGGLGALVEYLVKKKGYTCIRWLCLVNEPPTWWFGPGGKPVSLMPAIRTVRAELDRRGLSAVGISGPDFAWYPPRFKGTIFDWDDPAVGAFDIHDYTDSAAVLWAPLVERARKRKIPFFVSELGTWVGEDVNGTPESATPALYHNQLTNAEKMLRGLSLGVDGFNRWSFTNRGDLDGQWQLVRTWNKDKWEFLPRVTPEPIPYYSYGILTRFMAKHSSVLETRVEGDEVVAAAMRSPKGNATVYVLNKSGKEKPAILALAGMNGFSGLHKYQVTEAAIGKDDYAMAPLESYEIHGGQGSINDTLPPQSITVYTSYRLSPNDPGVTVD